MRNSGNQWWTEDQPIFPTGEVWKMVALLREDGLDPCKWGGKCSCTRIGDRMLRPTSFVSYNDQLELVAVAQAHGAYAIPFRLGQRAHLTAFGTTGYAALTSPNLAAAIDVLVQFSVLLNIKHAISTDGRGNIFLQSPSWETDLRGARIALFATNLIKIETFFREIAGPTFAFERFRVGETDIHAKSLEATIAALARANPAAEHRAHIRIAAETLKKPLALSQPEIHQDCRVECRTQIADIKSNIDIKTVITSKFHSLKNGMPSMAAVASELDMSERTLRRKLMRLGTSFSDLRDEVLSGLAENLLVKTGLTTEDVAEILGYSDAANFRHAFKRWQGKSPSFFRRESLEESLPVAV